MSKSKTKTVNIVSDLKQIIKTQEKIIKKIESERDQVEKLWVHYVDKSIDGWSWYGKYYHAYNNLVRSIREFDNASSVDDLKQKLNDDERAKYDYF